jgi:hypothetical protein
VPYCERVKRSTPRRRYPPGFVPAPLYAALPRDVHKAWILGIVFLASFVGVLVGGLFGLFPDHTFAPDLRVVPIAVVSLPVALLSARAFWRQLEHSDSTLRYLAWMSWRAKEEGREEAAREKREAARGIERAKAEAAADDEDDDDQDAESGVTAADVDPAYWMQRLSARVARLKRLTELRAPDPILENERKLVRDAIAHLAPDQALAVLHTWPEIAARFSADHDPDRFKGGGTN